MWNGWTSWCVVKTMWNMRCKWVAKSPLTGLHDGCWFPMSLSTLWQILFFILLGVMPVSSPATSWWGGGGVGSVADYSTMYQVELEYMLPVAEQSLPVQTQSLKNLLVGLYLTTMLQTHPLVFLLPSTNTLPQQSLGRLYLTTMLQTQPLVFLLPVQTHSLNNLLVGYILPPCYRHTPGSSFFQYKHTPLTISW